MDILIKKNGMKLTKKELKKNIKKDMLVIVAQMLIYIKNLNISNQKSIKII
jgi:hypothetical protein